MERAVSDQIKDFLNRGLEVLLLVHDKKLVMLPPNNLVIEAVTWPVWSKGGGTPTFGIAYTRWCRKLSNWLFQNLQPDDVLLFHGASAGAITQKLANRHKIISNPHGMEEFKFSLLRFPTRFFLSRLTRKSRMGDFVIATDSSLVSEVSKHILCSKDQIRLIPNSVNISYLDACASTSSFTPPNAGKLLVSVGRLAHNKGYDLLLSSLMLLDEKGELPDDFFGFTLAQVGKRTPFCRLTSLKNLALGLKYSPTGLMR